jgi:hypothetical protein
MKVKLIIFAIAFCFIACENQENDFDDFGSTSVYFPFQTPIRTIIQGNYDLGFNDNDNAGRFEIGVIMSGVYENDKDRKVSFELAPELININSINSIDPARQRVDSINVKLLPASYYTIEQESPVTIPSGSISGRIPIQLQDAFFDDPLSFAEDGEVHYVIPLKITAFEGLDSLLTGIPAVDNPIKILDDDWGPAPKDYTLFGIKFMNKYHGNHLRRGEDKFIGTSELFTLSTQERVLTNIDNSEVYNAEFVVGDEVTLVSTSGRNKASVTSPVRRDTIQSNSRVTVDMLFSDNGDITISPIEGGNQTVVGSGRWVENGDEWGGKKQNVIYLEYQYRDIDTVRTFSRGSLVSEEYIDFQHTVKDTLVMRNRNVKFEEFIVELKDE